MTQSGVDSAAASSDLLAADETITKAERAANALVTVVKRAKKTDGSPDASSMVKMLKAIREQLDLLGALRPQIEVLEGTWNATAERQFLEVEATLRDSCTRCGWRVDGQWPMLYVERAIPVEIDEKKRTALVGGTRVGSVSTAAIVGALEPQVRDLFPKMFTARAFMIELAAAYDEARGVSTQVPIFHVYRQLVIRAQKPRFWRNARAADFVSVGTDQFRARLTRVLEEGATIAPDGRELRLLPPIDPKDGLFVYQPAEARFGYVGRLEFVTLHPSNAL